MYIGDNFSIDLNTKYGNERTNIAIAGFNTMKHRGDIELKFNHIQCVCSAPLKTYHQMNSTNDTA